MTFGQSFTLLLIGLRLAGVISTSWWLIWLPYCIDVIAHIVLGACTASAERTLSFRCGQRVSARIHVETADR